MSHLSGKAAEQVNATHGDAGNLIVFDLRTLTHSREEEPYVQVLSDIGTARLVLFAFKAGQQLREHCTSSQNSRADGTWPVDVYCCWPEYQVASGDGPSS